MWGEFVANGVVKTHHARTPPLIMFTDTHCHFAEREGYDKDGAYARALENNVDLLIDVAFDVKSSFCAEEFAKDKDCVYFLAGIHPDAFDEVTEENIQLIKPIFSNPKCVGVGEIGLDYHYGKDKEGQKRAFERQILLADELKLPFAVHSRDCTEDMINLLKANKNLITNGGIMHCYSGSVETAKILLDLGFYISFSGTLTFKNARALPEVCDYLPLDRILSETDSPYLSPVPFRGTVNEPKNVAFVAQKIAEIKGEALEEVCQKIRRNTLDLFKKIKPSL